MSTATTKADTVIRNANVITMDPNRPRVQAVAMSNGRFIGLGRNEDVETFIGPGVKVMDLAKAAPCFRGSSTPTSTS